MRLLQIQRVILGRSETSMPCVTAVPFVLCPSHDPAALSVYFLTISKRSVGLSIIVCEYYSKNIHQGQRFTSLQQCGNK